MLAGRRKSAGQTWANLPVFLSALKSCGGMGLRLRNGFAMPVAQLVSIAGCCSYTMSRHVRNGQASRSSLRVATVLSLKGTEPVPPSSIPPTSSTRVRSKRTSTTVASRACPSPGPESDEDDVEDDASHVPRLDKPWVMYDLSGKAFTVNPVPSGMTAFCSLQLCLKMRTSQKMAVACR